MPKGITQEQVSAAADTLVTAGERPTVEKIRQALGTGSPNTVTRMLDAWRGALATRLSQVLMLPEVPADVGQAFTEVWRLAMTQAAALAQAALAQEQNALLAAQTSLTQERKLWEIALAEAQERVRDANQAREVAGTRLADVQRLVEQQAGQLAELLQQRDRQQALCDRQTGEIEALETQRNAHLAAADQEREGSALHIRAVEDRAHQEVDRARQEAKQRQQRLETAERAHRDAIEVLEAQGAASQRQLHKTEKEAARLAGQIAALETSLAKAMATARTRRTSRSTKPPKDRKIKAPR